MLFRGSSTRARSQNRTSSSPSVLFAPLLHNIFISSSRFALYVSFVYFCVLIEPILRGTIAELDSSRLRHFMCAVMLGCMLVSTRGSPESLMQQLLRYLPSKPCFVFVSLCIFGRSCIFASSSVHPFIHFVSCTNLNRVSGSEFRSSHQSW
jgi:hypothetical protein